MRLRSSVHGSRFNVTGLGMAGLGVGRLRGNRLRGMLLGRTALRVARVDGVVVDRMGCHMARVGRAMLDGPLLHVTLVDGTRLYVLLDGSQPRFDRLWFAVARFNLTRLSMMRLRLTPLGGNWSPLRGYGLLGRRVWSHVLSMLDIITAVVPRHGVHGRRFRHDRPPTGGR